MQGLSAFYADSCVVAGSETNSGLVTMFSRFEQGDDGVELQKLTRLDLSHQYFGAKGVTALCTTLQSLRSLKFLSLSGVGLDVEGHKAVAHFAVSHPSLTSLDVSRNLLYATGARSYTEMLQRNRRIHHFVADFDDVPHRIASRLMVAVGKNVALGFPIVPADHSSSSNAEVGEVEVEEESIPIEAATAYVESNLRSGMSGDEAAAIDDILLEEEHFSLFAKWYTGFGTWTCQLVADCGMAGLKVLDAALTQSTMEASQKALGDATAAKTVHDRATLFWTRNLRNATTLVAPPSPSGSEDPMRELLDSLLTADPVQLPAVVPRQEPPSGSTSAAGGGGGGGGPKPNDDGIVIVSSSKDASHTKPKQVETFGTRAVATGESTFTVGSTAATGGGSQQQPSPVVALDASSPNFGTMSRESGQLLAEQLEHVKTLTEEILAHHDNRSRKEDDVEQKGGEEDAQVSRLSTLCRLLSHVKRRLAMCDADTSRCPALAAVEKSSDETSLAVASLYSQRSLRLLRDECVYLRDEFPAVRPSSIVQLREEAVHDGGKRKFTAQRTAQSSVGLPAAEVRRRYGLCCPPLRPSITVALDEVLTSLRLGRDWRSGSGGSHTTTTTSPRCYGVQRRELLTRLVRIAPAPFTAFLLGVHFERCYNRRMAAMTAEDVISSSAAKGTTASTIGTALQALVLETASPDGLPFTADEVPEHDPLDAVAAVTDARQLQQLCRHSAAWWRLKALLQRNNTALPSSS